MVRYAGMSKGCETCRKRRIKCDEKLPSCSQCLRGRRKCPGAINGNIFMVTGLNTSRKHLRDGAVRPEMKNENQSGNKDHLKAERNIISMRAASMDAEQLVSLFISFFVKSAADRGLKPVNWMTLLPAMLSGNSDIGIRSSILAPALALYSQLSGNTSFEVESRKWYGRGLKYQRMKMLDISHSKQKSAPTAEDVSTAIMLAYYEVISSTSGAAYFQHVLGAAALLDAIGPQNCQTGPMHQLFQTVRLHIVYISIARRSQTVFATDEWTTVPFAVIPKRPGDYVIDILIKFPEIWQKPQKDNLSSCHINETLIKIIASLRRILRVLQDRDTPLHSLNHTLVPAIENTEIDLRELVPSIAISNSKTAIVVAFYSVACILVQVEIGRASLTDEEYNLLMITHCGNILKAAAHIENSEDGCGLIRMILPLRLVIHLSSDSSQRESARYRLELWRLDKGLSGICSVALMANTEILDSCSKADINMYTS
ncbi:hypothetical protein F5884DRAFT_762989 [Xylogone sp. PMI_703]|nr:hypothetical protein F5884DRAFT_762989 [Xylogone sp. PMI_703]